MAISATDLIVPVGALTAELLRALMPDAGSASAVAGQYADAGNDKVEGWVDEDRADRAAFAWATAQALLARAQQIHNTAASIADEGTSRAYNATQAAALERLAAPYLAEYERLAAEEDAPAPRPPALPPTSRSMPVTFAW